MIFKFDIWKTYIVESMHQKYTFKICRSRTRQKAFSASFSWSYKNEVLAVFYRIWNNTYLLNTELVLLDKLISLKYTVPVKKQIKLITSEKFHYRSTV